MRRIQSLISTSSAEFRRNDAHNRAAVAAFREKQASARAARPKRDLDRLANQGKMLPRKRIELLLDPGTPFLELSSLAGNIRSLAILSAEYRLKGFGSRNCAPCQWQ